MILSSSRTLLLALALSFAGPACARPPGDDAERQQRRAELREQLQAERERWRAGAHRGAPGAPGAPAAYGRHGRIDHGDGLRLSPEERRALRQDLREQRR